MAGGEVVELRRGDFRDPLEVLMRAESKTCAGCGWVVVVFNAPFCGADRRYGKRCSQYYEVDHGAG